MMERSINLSLAPGLIQAADRGRCASFSSSSSSSSSSSISSSSSLPPFRERIVQSPETPFLSAQQKQRDVASPIHSVRSPFAIVSYPDRGSKGNFQYKNKQTNKQTNKTALRHRTSLGHRGFISLINSFKICSTVSEWRNLSFFSLPFGLDLNSWMGRGLTFWVFQRNGMVTSLLTPSLGYCIN